MKNLEITPEIHQEWINTEISMAQFEGDDHPAVYSHLKIGKVIYGDKLEEVKDYIYNNSDTNLTIEDLQNYETNEQ